MVTLQQIQIKLSEAIKLSGLSQSEIANKLNVSNQTVSCYVHGKKLPALDTFANLCAALGADPADILCLSEYEK